MAETVILDPVEVSTGRTELDITPWISSEGIDWSDAAIEQYLAEAERGQIPVDFRIPNRQVTIPLRVKQHGAIGFDEARRRIQAKAALFQRRGGWLKRTLDSGQSYFLDITNATLRLSGGWLQAHRDIDTDASLVLDAIPDFYGPEEGDLVDNFSIDTIASGLWNVFLNSTTVSITGGQLVASSTSEKRFRRTDMTVYDSEITVTHKTPSAFAATYIVGVILKYLDDDNYIYARITENGAGTTGIAVRKRDAGVDSNLATLTAPAALGTGTFYKLRARLEGNKVTVEHLDSFDTVLTGGGTHTLTGGNDTKFGVGVGGNPGFSWVPQADAASARIDDFTVKPRVYVEKTNAELIAVLYGIKGDYPGRVRVIVDELDADTQLGLICSLSSQHYSPAATARPAYEAEALTALDTAAIATVTGASGGGSNNAVQHSNLGTDWTAILSTDIASVGAMTHVGTKVVLVRCRTTSSAPPELRLVYDVGDLVLPEELDPVAIPGANNFYLVVLGQIRLDQTPIGAHRWKGVIQGRGAIGGENAAIDKVWVLDATEFYTLLSAPQNADPGLVAYLARDEFNQSAGALAGKTLPVGGTWAGAGDADDFTVETAGKTAQRTATLDSGDWTFGRFAIAGSTNYAATAVGIDGRFSLLSGNFTAALVARWIDSNNFLVAGFDRPSNSVRVYKKVAGTFTQLFFDQADFTFPLAGDDYSMRLLVDAAGRWFFWLYPKGGRPGAPVAGEDSALATGGALASGKPGFYDYYGSSPANTRNYDNFKAWPPTLDAVLHASQQLEIRTDGVFRKDAAGAAFGPLVPLDRLPRIPPQGLERSPAELVIKHSRGDFQSIPDSSSGDDIRAQVLYRASWLGIPTAA